MCYVGAFGVVSLVRERSSGQLFAMKQVNSIPSACYVSSLFLIEGILSPQLRKTDMLRKGQEGHVRAERDVLKSASLVNSPSGADWIVKLYYSFQDRDHLYLVGDRSLTCPPVAAFPAAYLIHQFISCRS